MSVELLGAGNEAWAPGMHLALMVAAGEDGPPENWVGKRGVYYKMLMGNVVINLIRS